MAYMQALLRVGIVRSKRASTKTHSYGYMKNNFLWSVVKAMGILQIARTTCFSGIMGHMKALPWVGIVR